jgi:hypothetical protein
MRSLPFSTTVLNMAQLSFTRRFEYHRDVSSILTRTSSCSFRASASVSPTPASGGIVRTTLRYAPVVRFPLIPVQEIRRDYQALMGGHRGERE